MSHFTTIALIGVMSGFLTLLSVANQRHMHHWAGNKIKTAKAVPATHIAKLPAAPFYTHLKQERSQCQHAFNVNTTENPPFRFPTKVVFAASSFLIFVVVAMKLVHPVPVPSYYTLLAVSNDGGHSDSVDDVQKDLASLEDLIKSIENAINVVEKDIKAVADRIEQVEKEIDFYKSVIVKVEKGEHVEMVDQLYCFLNKERKLDIDKLEANLVELRKKEDRLRTKEDRLRTKEEQLRKKEEQLRKKEEQLRKKEEQLRDKEASLVEKEKGKQFVVLKDRQDYMREMMNAKVEGRHLTTSKVYTRDNAIGLLSAFEGEELKLVVRDFYEDLAKEILEAISRPKITYVYLSGTPGTGKTMFRNFMVWRLLQNFNGRALRIVMAKGHLNSADLLCLEPDGTYYALTYNDINSLRTELEEQEWVKGQNLFCLADLSEGKKQAITLFAGCVIVFTSPNNEAWKEEQKESCPKFWMLLWTEDELFYDENHQEVVKKRIELYGGLPRLVWGDEITVDTHEKERLNEVPTLESFSARAGDTEFIPSGVQHRFIYLIVHKDEKGKYDFRRLPSAAVGTRHIATKMINHYFRSLNEKLSLQFVSRMPPVLQGQLFEVAAFELLSAHADECAFHIKALKNVSQQNWVHKQLTVGKSKAGFRYFRPPQCKRIEFDGDRDAMQTMLSNLRNTDVVFGLPRSFQLAGFDAILAWNGTLDQRTLPQTPQKRKRPRQINHSEKFALLLQATLSEEHPMSKTGITLIEQFREQFQVAIVYVVPVGISSSFPAQRKKSDAPESDEFNATPQWCLYIAPDA